MKPSRILLGLLTLFPLHAAPTRPIAFEPGVAKNEFRAQSPNGALILNTAGIRLGAVLLTLPGAQLSAPTGEGLLPSRTHYYLGNDPTAWRANVANYSKVRYQNVYPGIDLVFYPSPSNTGDLEYDFLVQPGADPSRIRLQFTGAKLRLDSRGDLRIGNQGLTHRRPHIFQQGHEIPGNFHLAGPGLVRFKLGAYDHSQPLTIDPVIQYFSYLGGNAHDSATTVAVDATGNVYVGGEATSTDFPGTSNFPRRSIEYQYGYITKFAPIVNGKSQLLYTIYLGDQRSNTSTRVLGLVTDRLGNLIATGSTLADSFPVINAYQPALSGALDCKVDVTAREIPCTDGFLTKFNPEGTAILFSTYYGGRYTNFLSDLGTDADGGIYALGIHNGAEGPTDLTGSANAYQPRANGSADMMITRWDATGRLLYASFFGGASGSDFGVSVAVEKPGVVWIGGNTTSRDMPMPSTNNGVQPKYTSLSTSAYLARLDLNLNGTAALTYATYFGGAGNTNLAKLFVDPAGSVHFCGGVVNDIPVTTIRMQNYGGVPSKRFTAGYTAGDAYFARINPNVAGLPGLTYSTYIGGADSDSATGCALDPNGNFVVSGYTLSKDLFLIGGSPIPLKFYPGTDAPNGFLIRIDPKVLGGRIDSILFGGDAGDVPFAMATDAKGSAYVVGETRSRVLPVTASGIQKKYGGDNTNYLGTACCGDAFLMQADLLGPQAGATGVVQGSGDYQFAAPGASLPAPIVAQLSDKLGNPLALSGYPVYFTATNATLTPTSAFTDPSGQATTTVQLGSSDATVVATVGDNYTPYTFHLRAVGGTLPKSVAIVSGDKQSGVAGARLAQPLVVELRDASNAPLPQSGFIVQWKPANATVPALTATTDSTGRATSPVTLGPLAGASGIQVIVGALPAVQATFTITGGSPSISTGGILSAASFLGGGVAPGEIVTIFGAGIGPTPLAVNASDSTGKFPTILAGTQVLFDGVAAPVIYASANQTSVIVPYSVSTKTSTLVTVVNQGLTSSAQSVIVLSSHPALFSANSSGKGQGAILNQDNSVNSTANPAKRNSIVILYGTGEGQTTPAGVDGQVALATYPKPLTPMTVKIAGADGQVLYYGAAPTLVAGVFQINVKIPTGIPDGDATVQIFEGPNQSLPTITVAIKGDQ